ncbi:MAG TPA: hypothetical protein VG838_09425 [Opitutaceae bacterium]|nr:hypothetical protein [Opitutaceae bacterium]
MSRTLPLSFAALVLLSACSSPARSPHDSSSAVVYNPPDSKSIDRRANDLQAKGYSPAAAQRRANAEAADQSWETNSTSDYAYEQARAQAEARDDKMNAELRRQEADRFGR